MSYDGRVQVWIRKDDRPAWDAIPKDEKAEWLHEHLQIDVRFMDDGNYSIQSIKSVRKLDADYKRYEDERYKQQAKNNLVVNDHTYEPMD